MNALAIRLIGGGLLAAGLLAAGLDWRSARQARGELKVCTLAARDAARPIDGCDQHVASVIKAQRNAVMCDTALRRADAAGQRSWCNPIVRDQAILLHATTANLADARDQLAKAEARTIAAVSRAEARATKTLERKAHAQAVIARAPRDAGGIISCNAECLRDLAGAGTHR